MINPFTSALNKLRCPICKAQIDMLDRAGYGCAANSDHYQVNISSHDIAVTWEKVNIYTKKHKYSIIKTYEQANIHTEIFIRDVDLEGRVIFTFDVKSYKTNVNMFDFTNFNSEKAINRINTILVFQ